MTWTLTHEDGHQEPGDPLLLHLLDHGLLSWSRGFAHDGQSVDVSDRADSGRREPGQTEQRTDGPQDHDQQQVQVEPRAFNQPTLLLTHYQAEREMEQRTTEA